MKNYKYEYLICNTADRDIFEKQCAALERQIPGLIKGSISLDPLDHSAYQTYLLYGQEIQVVNSYYLDHVVIQSDVDIEPYFA